MPVAPPPSPSTQATLAGLDWSLHAARPTPPHAIHPYPAKFIPQLARLCIEAAQMQGPIIDPFCGSGTTLVEAQRLGHQSVGVDLNPVACLISRVKTMRPSPDTLGSCRALAGGIGCLGDELWDAPRVEHWFSVGARQFLASAKRDIAALDDPSVAAVLRLAVCRILVSISRQESDTRYAAVDNELDASTCQDRFVGAVAVVCAQLETYSRSLPETAPTTRVVETDSRRLAACGFEAASFGGAVFSPPYPNAYEYWLYHKYRAYWLDGEPTAVRALEIGARPHYSKPNNLTADDFASDLAPVFGELWRIVRPRGAVAVVVGDSVIKGDVVDNGALVKRVAETAGFSTRGHVDRELPAGRRSFRANRLRTEHVLIFERGDA